MLANSMPMTPAPTVAAVECQLSPCHAQALGNGAGGHDDGGSGVGFRGGCNGVAAKGTGVEEAGLAVDDRDVGVGEERVDACAELGDDLVLAGQHLGEVEVVAQVVETEEFGFLQRLNQFGIAGVALRRDAALVEASATHVGLFEDYHLQPLLGSV